MYDPPAYLWAIIIAGPTAVAALTCIVLYGGAVRAGLGRRRAALLAGTAAAVFGGWPASHARGPRGDRRRRLRVRGRGQGPVPAWLAEGRIREGYRRRMEILGRTKEAEAARSRSGWQITGYRVTAGDGPVRTPHLAELALDVHAA